MAAVWEEGEQDSQGNVIRGDVYAQSMRNSLLIGWHRLLSAVGLEDVIVVEKADAVLVTREDSAQDVKELVARLKPFHAPRPINAGDIGVFFAAGRVARDASGPPGFFATGTRARR